jgi:hypothetical protein
VVRVAVVLALCVCLGGAFFAYRQSNGVGYVQINTVPVAPLTSTALYLDSTKVDPIHQGSALLRQRVGTVTLQASGLDGAMAPLCTIEVQRDRLTTVTVSVLDRPPRCQCKFAGGTNRACIS